MCFCGVLIVFLNKIENEQVRTSNDVVKKEYSIYLNELFERYSSNELVVNNSNSTSLNSISKQEQQKQIREALMKGYVEMSHINLTICTECQHAEYDAQHTTERLVSGG
jgi:hypothetical protein